MKYKITFLGSKGMIEEYDRWHRYRTGIIIETPRTRFMIDCGEERFFSYLGGIEFLTLSHKHPDHTDGIKGKRVKIPLVASPTVLRQLKTDLKVQIDKPVSGGIKHKDVEIRLIPCYHSVLAPMWGIIVNEELGVFTDIIAPRRGWRVLKNLKYYIGDGSAITRPLIRRHKETGEIFGHTTIKTQLRKALQFGWEKIIFTHFGKEAVEMDERKLKEILGKDVIVARDKMTITLE